MSLLLSHTEAVQGALQVTGLLTSFYAQHESYRPVVRAVLHLLRTHGALNKHGWKQNVGQAVKTATTALMCAALKIVYPHLATEEQVLSALASFDAPRLAIIWMPAAEVVSGDWLTACDDWVVKQERRWRCTPTYAN